MGRVCESCGFDAEFLVVICPNCGARAAVDAGTSGAGVPWEKTVVRTSQDPRVARRPRFDRADEFYEQLSPLRTPDPGEPERSVAEPDATIVDRTERDRGAATVVLRDHAADEHGPLAYLVERSGPHTGNTHQLRGLTLIGRGPGADLVLAATSVSKRHASVRIDEGRFVFWDMASTNASYLVNPDGTRARIVEPHVLVDGDTLDLGNARLTFLLVDGRDRA
jgi:hypothetical protein